MRSLTTILAALLVALLTPACKGSKPRPKPAPPPGSICTVPLAEHCGKRGCPTFEARAAELRSTVGAHYDAGSCLTRATIGSCGDLKYVESSDGYYSRTDYFDSTGKQVAGEGWSDIGSCDGTASKAIAGTLPSCAQKPTEVLCPRPARKP